MSSVTGEIQPGFLNMPRLPVAGLRRRLPAVLIDWIVLLSALHVAARFAPDLFRALGQWSPYVTSLFVFLYFVLLNGGYGGGRTIGKLFLGIRTTDYDGNPITLRQSVIRTVTIMPLFVSVPLTEAFLPVGAEPIWNYVATCITYFAFVAILVASAISLPFNPFKQGLHDFFAETLVRPVRKEGDPADLSFADLAERVGFDWIKFHRQPQYSSGVTFFLVFGFLAVTTYPGYSDETLSEAREVIRGLNANPGMEKAFIPFLPQPPARLRGEAAAEELIEIPDFPEGFLLATDIDETTPTLPLVITISRPGSWSREWKANRMEDTAEILAQTYYPEVFPRVIRYIRENGNANEVAVADAWAASPLRLVILFREMASLTPYPFPVESYPGFFAYEFPPLEGSIHAELAEFHEDIPTSANQSE